MNFVSYNIPKIPRSKNYIGAATTSFIRTAVAQSTSSSGGQQAPTLQEACKFSIVEVSDLEYPLT